MNKLINYVNLETISTKYVLIQFDNLPAYTF